MLFLRSRQKYKTIQEPGPRMGRTPRKDGEGGLLVLDSDRIDVDPERTDITVVKVPADSIAKELGNPKVMNMVVLGAMLKARPIFDADIVIANLAEVLGPKKANLVELNKKAVEMGAAQAGD